MCCGGCHDIPCGYHGVPCRLPRGLPWYHPRPATASPTAPWDPMPRHGMPRRCHGKPCVVPWPCHEKVKECSTLPPCLPLAVILGGCLECGGISFLKFSVPVLFLEAHIHDLYAIIHQAALPRLPLSLNKCLPLILHTTTGVSCVNLRLPTTNILLRLFHIYIIHQRQIIYLLAVLLGIFNRSLL